MVVEEICEAVTDVVTLILFLVVEEEKEKEEAAEGEKPIRIKTREFPFI